VSLFQQVSVNFLLLKALCPNFFVRILNNKTVLPKGNTVIFSKLLDQYYLLPQFLPFFGQSSMMLKEKDIVVITLPMEGCMFLAMFFFMNILLIFQKMPLQVLPKALAILCF